MKYRKGVKITFTKKQLGFVSVLILTTSLIFLYIYILPKPITAIDYYGNILSFRVDLREANTIPIYNKESIEDLIWNEKLKKLAIAFLNTSDMGIVAVEAFEITNKLTIAYLRNGTTITTSDIVEIPPNYIKLKVIPLNFSEELDTEAFDTIIFLIPPSQANETSVRVKDNVIYIQGKNNKEFDLATVRFLIEALRIRI
jgi:hypothetical protein